MKDNVSAGGVVFLDDTVLLLQKNNGDWVLPKGHIEGNEHRIETALREVKEESGVVGVAHEYLGSINYDFYDAFNNYEYKNKTVHWYLMTARTTDLKPQREEGFVGAAFVPMGEVVDKIRYQDERNIVVKALDVYKSGYLE